MASARAKYISASILAAGLGVYFTYSVFAVQGQGTELAQAPLNTEVHIPPAFIMAVDDSGSMTYHNQFPAQDGRAHWNRNAKSFFNSNGTLRTSGNSSYVYAYTSARSGTNFYGIPPVDTFGFARSPDFNPAYFNPLVKYEPWLNSDGKPYGATAANPSGNASRSATRIDPRNTDTINLASWLLDENARSRFQTDQGMFFPSGTEYEMVGNNNCGGLSKNGGTIGSGGHEVTDSCAVYIKYYPATFFLKYTADNDARPAPADAPTAYASVPRTRVRNACGANCDLWKYEIRSTDTAALQNFANWFSFYGNRNRAMIAGMTRSMAEVNNMRVGYFTINNRVTVAMRDMAVPADRESLYTSMLALPTSGNTPNLPAVDHLGKQFQRTDAGAPIQRACQKNGGMLFTDGFSNIAATAPAVTGLGAPFDPTPADSLAAIASRYYFNNAAGNSPLRAPSAALAGGQVPVPDACKTLSETSVEWKRLDCQKNLHMNFYGVTLGATGEIFNPDLDQDAFTLNPAWPGYVSNARSTIDDIWHATVNTRGDFINAKTPADITAAMRRILSSMTGGASPAGTIAMTGSRIGTGSLTVTPFYEARNDGTDWYAKLTAHSVATDPTTQVPTFTEVWEASARLPSASARSEVYFGNASGVVNRFSATNLGGLGDLCNSTRAGMSRCSADTIAALGGTASPITLAQAVDYLKGDQSLEVDRNTNGVLRFRTTRLGDIVNSSPVVSSPTDDYGYRSLPTPYGDSYGSYMTAKASRRPMVYVGANDGMFHAFDGRAGAEGGVERFAYIPRNVVGHMGNLLFPLDSDNDNDQKFQHRYFVDGPVVVSDAYYGSSWKTVAVATAGAGARSVFALDVSPASGASGAFSASDRLWEIDDRHADTAVANNIGHVLGKPVIVPVKDRSGAISWKAIFGNGYNSNNNNAVLFVVNIGGTGVVGDIQMIQATETGAPAGRNGLGNVVVVDRFGGSDLNAKVRDGFADTVYAADRKGAVWKFDLRAATPANVTTPLFVTRAFTGSGPEAGTRQPILGGLTAAAGPRGGVMIYFGTGSFSFRDDEVADNTIQSLYAVLDEGGTSTITRSHLHQQTITSTDDGIRFTSGTPMPLDRSGWFLDLTAGERFVGYPRIESGIVFLPTYAPETTAQCASGGNNWLYGLNALTGAASLSSVRVGSPTGDSPGTGAGAAQLNTGGSAPVKEVAVMTSPRVSPLGPTATEKELETAIAAQCSMIVQVSGAPPLFIPRACGRQSWRQAR